jgi:hypothetical protein
VATTDNAKDSGENFLDIMLILITFKQKLRSALEMKTLYNIEVNPALLWDYEFSPTEMGEESFLVWYLGRLLERGMAAEGKRLPIEVIARYLNRLSISRRVRRFWEWYIKNA